MLQVIVASYSGKILSFTAEPVLQRAQVRLLVYLPASLSV